MLLNRSLELPTYLGSEGTGAFRHQLLKIISRGAPSRFGRRERVPKQRIGGVCRRGNQEC